MSRSHEGEYRERTQRHGGHLDPSVVRHPHDDRQAVLERVDGSQRVSQ